METELLANLIERKCGVLTQIRQLARRQVEIVQEGDTTKLLTLLAAKQSLLGDLQSLERQLDPFRNQDPDHRRWASPAHRQAARDMATRCESLLSEILVIEKNCEHDLVARRDAAADRLQDMQNAAHATTAYTQPLTSRGQLDLSSET